MEGAVQITIALGLICEDLSIPIGFLGEPGRHGSHKGDSSFDPGATNQYDFPYLHPQFLKGEPAKDFVRLLVELVDDTDQWEQIEKYLGENTPVLMKDLESAREKFAPELLLPVELRSLSKHIPIGADQSELTYLTAKIEGMDNDQRNVFDAVVEAGWNCGSVTEIINLTENLDCFTFQPDYTMTTYGEYRLEKDWDVCESVVLRLEKSKNPAERALAQYVYFLGRCVDEESYGYNAAKEENGAFTANGLVTHERGLEEIYHGPQDIPAEYRIIELSAEKTEKQPIISKKIKRQITDVEENIGANLLNLNEATYSAAVGGHDELVDFIHQHEQEYDEYVRQNYNGYADSTVIKEFGYDEPEKPSVLGQIAKAREAQKKTKAEGHKNPAHGKKKTQTPEH